MKPLSDITAPDLLREWRKLVGENVLAGRDLKLFKDALVRYTPAQLLFGFTQFRGVYSVTVPKFLDLTDEWLLKEESWAKIELAVEISQSTPKEYFIWRDLREEQDAQSYIASQEARRWLLEWSERVLG